MKQLVSKRDSDFNSLEVTRSPDTPKCDRYIVHLDCVRASREKLLDTETAQQMAEVFGILADANRLRLISVLASEELCVCDLAALMKVSESAICQQLRLLKAMRLVKYRREGRKIYYSLGDGNILNMYHCLMDNLKYLQAS